MVADQSECKIKQRVDNGKGSRSHATSQMSLGVFIPSKHRHLLKSGLPVFPKQLPPSVGALKIQLIPASTTLTTESIDLDVPESGKTTVRYTVFRRKRLLFQGDHVVVRGSDESIYFGIIQNIFIGSLGDRRVLLRWLLPRPQFMSKIDGPPENICPTYFKLGPLQSRSESVEACIVDVFYSPVLIGLQRCRYYCDGFVNFDTKLYGDPESLFAPEESENKWRSNVLPPLPRTFSAPSVDTKDICVSEGTTKKFLENGPDYLELEKNKSLNAENQIKVKTIQQDVYLDSYQFSSSQKELGDGSKLNLDNSDTPVTLGLLSRETSNDDQPVIVTTPNDKAKRRSSRRRPSSVVSNPIDTDDGYLNVFSPSIVALSTVDSSVEVKAEDSDGVRPAVIVASIVEEVEMAHLLCSMFLS